MGLPFDRLDDLRLRAQRLQDLVEGQDETLLPDVFGLVPDEPVLGAPGRLAELTPGGFAASVPEPPPPTLETYRGLARAFEGEPPAGFFERLEPLFGPTRETRVHEAKVERTARELAKEARATAEKGPERAIARERLSLDQMKELREQQQLRIQLRQFLAKELETALTLFGSNVEAAAAYLEDLAADPRIGLQLPPEVYQGIYRLVAANPETIGQVSQALTDSSAAIVTPQQRAQIATARETVAKPPSYGEAVSRIIDARFGPGAARAPTQEMLDYADREIQRRQVEVSAQQGAAGVTARGQAELDLPMGLEQASRVVDPTTLATADPRMTEREAMARGLRQVTPKQREDLADLQNADALVAVVERLADRLITAEGPAAIQQGLSLRAQAATRVGPQADLAKTYLDTREQFLGVLARTFGGERGVLTDRDIARVGRGYPSLFDTKGVKDTKLGILRIIAETAAGAKRRAILGDPPDPQFRPKLDRLFDALDAQAPPAEGAPASTTAPTPEGFEFQSPSTGKWYRKSGGRFVEIPPPEGR